ncbi:hypothetical protein D3C85_1193210 [compost metagenome]
MLARHDDPDPDAALERGDQCLPRQVVRHEVRRRQVNGARGGGDGEQVHQRHVLAAAGGGTAEHLRHALAHLRQCREIPRAVGDFAAHLDPVVEEDRLHLGHHGAFDLEMRVAPMLGVLGVAGPFRRNAHAAGEADPAVDDQELPVGTVVELAKRVPVHRVIALQGNAGVRHDVQHGVVHLLASHPVQQDMHLHAGLRAFGQRLRELPANLARPVDV